MDGTVIVDHVAGGVSIDESLISADSKPNNQAIDDDSLEYEIQTQIVKELDRKRKVAPVSNPHLNVPSAKPRALHTARDGP